MATVQRDGIKRQEQVSAAETALARAQEQAAKALAGRQAELERARAEIELLKASSEQHKRDRDVAERGDSGWPCTQPGGTVRRGAGVGARCRGRQGPAGTAAEADSSKRGLSRSRA